MAVVAQQELVERIWSRDATLWTGEDEDKWLGWLDEPKRMQEKKIDELTAFAEEARTAFDTFVLLGMGGSSLAPEVLKRTFEVKKLHVLDTTHPAMIRHVEDFLDLERTLFIVSSKSGGTLETLSHLAYYHQKVPRSEAFVVVTDPGSPLEARAREEGFRVFSGEPTIGGRYSALSPFGLVPAALMGIDLERLLSNAVRMSDACRGEANPGLQLGLRLGEAWREGRDKVAINPNPGGFGLWAEQLIAESTGKNGKGLIPAPDESPEGPDRQGASVEIADPYSVGGEFFRWEFAVAVAGTILGVNVFNQPDVQAAKDKTNEVLQSGQEPALEPEGSLDELLEQAEPPNYIAIQAFIDPMRERELQPLIDRAHETGCVVTHGLGPRYLHSTGQLHKGGPPTGLFVQVVDAYGDEIPIPGQDFGFRRLIRAQAEGDFQSLKSRGRQIVRVRLGEFT